MLTIRWQSPEYEWQRLLTRISLSILGAIGYVALGARPDVSYSLRILWSMGIKLRWRTLHVITLHDHLEQIERFGPLSRLSVEGESSNSPPIAGPGGVGGQRSHCGTSGGDPRAQATVEPKVPTLGASGGRGTSRWHRDGVRRDLWTSSDVGQVPSCCAQCPQSPRSSRATGPFKWPLFNKGPEDGRAVSPHIYRDGHRDVRAGAGFRSRPHWHACDRWPGTVGRDPGRRSTRSTGRGELGT